MKSGTNPDQGRPNRGTPGGRSLAVYGSLVGCLAGIGLGAVTVCHLIIPASVGEQPAAAAEPADPISGGPGSGHGGKPTSSGPAKPRAGVTV
jgi:hypothetical protein